MRAVVYLLRLLLAGVFLYAAYSKLRQPWLLFAMSIDSYGILPYWAVLSVARVIPWLELPIGLALLTGLGLRYAAVMATALLGLFFAVMLRSYIQGLSIDCGCFGIGEALSAKTLARDALLILFSVVLSISALRMARCKSGSGSRNQRT